MRTHAVKRLALIMALCAATPTLAQSVSVINAEAWTLETAEPVRNATIVVQDGRIVSVTANGAPAPGTQVIDARGKPVTMGMVNAASHLGLLEVSSATDTNDSASRDDRGGSFDLSRALNGNSTLVSLARADGLTRAVVIPGQGRGGPLSGEVSIARLRDGSQILDSANVAVLGTIGGGEWERLGSRSAQWQALRKQLADAKAPAEPKRGGGKKGKSGRPSEPIKAVMSGDIPLAIQTHRETDIREAIALAKDFGIRLIIVGGAEAWRVADELAAAKIAVILDPQANLPYSFDQLGARQDSAAILAKAGVPIAFGMVGGPIHATYNAGIALRWVAGIAVANGLPYAEALRATTMNPLAIWGGSAGTMASGSDADLVVWDGDPLEPATNAVAVIIEGRPVSIRSRHDLLAERYAGAGR